MDLNLTWFVLLGILLAGYAVLDGFDLGVGILHPLTRTDDERRLAMAAIGPLWDGNEVWLVTFGGALFAAFPEAYAAILPAFYTPFMVIMFCLIFRAVSLEFRNKKNAPLWRGVWDFAFFFSSLVASFVFGLAVANGVIGIELDHRGDFRGSLSDLVTVYPVMVGLMTVAMFAMHGALFLHLKTAGGMQRLFYRWIWHAWGTFLVLYMLTTMFTIARIPRATANFDHAPWAIGVVVLSVLAVANIPRAVFHKQVGQAFASSCVVIVCQVTLIGVALFPNLVSAVNNESNSLTIYNAASSVGTLKLMLVIAIIGMPLVLAYTAVVYWTFRGKVTEDFYH